MSAGGTNSLARLQCTPGVGWSEQFDDQPDGATSDSGDSAWTLTPSAAASNYGVGQPQNNLRMFGTSTWEAVIPNSTYTGPMMVDIVCGQSGGFVISDAVQFYVALGTGSLSRIGEMRAVENSRVVRGVIGAVAGQTITVRIAVQTADSTRRFELAHVIARPILGGMHWVEWFEELANGATSDTGATAWTRTLSGIGAAGQVAAMSSGKAFLLSKGTTWLSQSIAIPAAVQQGGNIDLYLRARSDGVLHLGSDNITAEYSVNGGAWNWWAALYGANQNMQVYTARVTGWNAATIRLRVVSNTLLSTNRYLIDEISMVAYC